MKSSHSLALDTASGSFQADAGGRERTPPPYRPARTVASATGSASAGGGGQRPERASREASPFGPDVILPAQYYERSSTLEVASGEKALMLAVLEDGIRCFQEHLKNPRVRPRLLARQAERWIRSKDWEWPFSFNNVCESLELNPECLRARLLAPREEGAAPSKPRSSHRVYRLTPRVKPPRRR
jgi:hypothetical protein